MMNLIQESQYNHVEKGVEEYIGTFSWEKKLIFFWILSKLPPPFPQFRQLVQLFSEVEIQDLNDSVGLKILYVLYIILYKENQKMKVTKLTCRGQSMNAQTKQQTGKIGEVTQLQQACIKENWRILCKVTKLTRRRKIEEHKNHTTQGNGGKFKKIQAR